MTVKNYVEGGGDHNSDLQRRCREGFSKFFQKAGLEGRMPKVISCGGRKQAFDNFRTAHVNATENEFPILLVDSEGPVNQGPWEHVATRQGDQWPRPEGASDDQLQFMVEAMEAWFYADKGTLGMYFGRGFRSAALSQRPDVEAIPKVDLLDALKRATKDCQKGEYAKGKHSFEILALIEPAKVAVPPSACGAALNRARPHLRVVIVAPL